MCLHVLPGLPGVRHTRKAYGGPEKPYLWWVRSPLTTPLPCSIILSNLCVTLYHTEPVQGTAGGLRVHAGAERWRV
jgi:hypothetical protein